MNDDVTDAVLCGRTETAAQRLQNIRNYTRIRSRRRLHHRQKEGCRGGVMVLTSLDVTTVSPL